MAPRIGIISYCDRFRTYAHVNHQRYADIHGYTYVFDAAPTRTGRFTNKLEKIRKFLPLFDYVFWIDDDAFFMQMDQPLTGFLKGHRKSQLVFCKSPVIAEGKWTHLSAGNFFLKNTEKVLQWLTDTMTTDLDDVYEWWNGHEYGHFTRGDQDAMIYQLDANPSYRRQRNFYTLLPFEAFNSRPLHFTHRADQQFLVHFTGDNKGAQAVDFARKWSLSPALITEAEFAQYHGVFEPDAAGRF